MIRAALLLLVASFVSGCAHAHLKADWATPEELAYDVKKHPDSAAVYLLRADKTALLYDNGWFTQTLRHDVVRVQKEAAFDLAEVKVPYWANEEILELKARVIQPDGGIQELEPKNMLSDTKGTGERDLNAKYFRFPDVSLGSLLEYVYVVERPRLETSDDQQTVGYFPVERYQFELTAAKPIVLEAKEYNSTYPIETRTLGDGRHQLLCELRDIPERKRLDFAPDWTFVEPRWAWRAVAYRQGSMSYDWQRSWNDVAADWAKVVYGEREMFKKGFGLKLDVSKCSDAACKVDAALALMRSKVTADLGAQWNRSKSVSEVLEGAQGSTFERAAVVQRLLLDNGIEAWLGFTTAKYLEQTDRDFPSVSRFDLTLVWVPKQSGLERELWLDPGCDFCTQTQLPLRSQGADVLVFRAKPGLGSEPETEAEWRVARGDDAPTSSERHVVTLKVGETGDTDVEDQTTTTGLSSRDDQAQKVNATQTAMNDWVRTYFRGQYPLARGGSFSWGVCERGSGRCEWSRRATLPRYAVPDAQRLLVPTTMLSRFSALFDDAEHKEDIAFTGDEYTDEWVLEYTVPEGYQLKDAPFSKTDAYEGFSALVKLEKTATGARLTQQLKRPLKVIDHRDYDDVRRVAGLFKSARQLLLTFEKK